MSLPVSLSDQIHAKALEVSRRYKRTEAELVDILQQVEDHRIFMKIGYPSLFSYITAALGISENIAYSLITVARKAREVPALKARILSGEVTLSNARRVASVLTPDNQMEWLQKASELSNRQLEREIVKVRPLEKTVERASYVSAERIRLELGLSEREMLRLRRVQDLISQSMRRPVSLEETIGALTREFLTRNDPLEKAKRHQVRKGVLDHSNGPQVGAMEADVGATAVDVGAAKRADDKPAVRADSSAKADLREAQAQFSVGDRSSASFQQAGLVTRLVRRERIVRGRQLTRREPIPANLLHQVNLRDQRRCTHVLPSGKRCNETRWIEIHHKIPVHQGGANTVANLTTLCGTHHRLCHMEGGAWKGSSREARVG